MKAIYYLYVSIICFFLFFFLTIFIVNGNTIFFDMPSYTWILSLKHTNYFVYLIRSFTKYNLKMFFWKT